MAAAPVRALVETEIRACPGCCRSRDLKPISSTDRLAAQEPVAELVSGRYLLHPVDHRPVLARGPARRRRARSEALHDAGDHATVTALLSEVLRRGNGADFQRAAFARTGSVAGVAAAAAEVTAGPRN